MRNNIQKPLIEVYLARARNEELDYEKKTEFERVSGKNIIIGSLGSKSMPKMLENSSHPCILNKEPPKSVVQKSSLPKKITLKRLSISNIGTELKGFSGSTEENTLQSSERTSKEQCVQTSLPNLQECSKEIITTSFPTRVGSAILMPNHKTLLDLYVKRVFSGEVSSKNEAKELINSVLSSGSIVEYPSKKNSKSKFILNLNSKTQKNAEEKELNKQNIKKFIGTNEVKSEKKGSMTTSAGKSSVDYISNNVIDRNYQEDTEKLKNMKSEMIFKVPIKKKLGYQENIYDSKSTIKNNSTTKNHISKTNKNIDQDEEMKYSIMELNAQNMLNVRIIDDESIHYDQKRSKSVMNNFDRVFNEHEKITKNPSREEKAFPEKKEKLSYEVKEKRKEKKKVKGKEKEKEKRKEKEKAKDKAKDKDKVEVKHISKKKKVHKMNNDKELHTDQEKHTDQENESGSEINKTKNTKNNCATSEAFLFKPKKKKKENIKDANEG